MVQTFFFYFFWILKTILEAGGLFIAATLVFDAVHYTLHQFFNSKWVVLQKLGNLHQAHHKFFDQKLHFNDKYIMNNLLAHLIPEYATQMTVCVLSLTILNILPVLLIMFCFTGAFVNAALKSGRDLNHISYEVLPSARESVIVGPAYHGMHHIYPESYFASFTTLFDRLMSTGCQLKGRRVLMTNISEEFGATLKRLLEKQGALVNLLELGFDYSCLDFDKINRCLSQADILVLSHAFQKKQAMQVNCDLCVTLIEHFKNQPRKECFPLEVWALGSKIESSPHLINQELKLYYESKRSFARYARRYFADNDILYRHIVAPEYHMLPRGRLQSGKTSAWLALFLIRRGCRFVPLTISIYTLGNFFKFLFRVNLIPLEQIIKQKS